MISRDVAVVLIGIGFVLFVIGWILVFAGYGVEIEKCSTIVSIPSRFRGTASITGNATQYKAIIITKIDNVSLRAGEPYKHNFTLRSPAVAPIILYYTITSPTSVQGYIVIRGMNDTVIASTPLQHQQQTISTSKILDVNIIAPGNYYIEIDPLTDMTIKSLNITALTYVSSPAIEVTFTPSSFDYSTLNYVCGVSFTGLIVAATLIGFGTALVSFVGLYLYRESQRVSKEVIPSGKIKKKKG